MDVRTGLSSVRNESERAWCYALQRIETRIHGVRLCNGRGWECTMLGSITDRGEHVWFLALGKIEMREYGVVLCNRLKWLSMVSDSVTDGVEKARSQTL